MNTSVKDFGAVGDGATLDTVAIQRAIDACANAGGGRVLLEEGRFLSGTLTLHSGVDLHIDASATLLASGNIDDYPEISGHIWHSEYAPRANSRCFIYAEDCTDIAITGRGRIDCNGQDYVEKRPDSDVYYPDGERCFIWAYARKNVPTPPRVIMFFCCNGVLFRDVTMQNQPSGWGYWVEGCRNVRFDGLVINANVEFPNNDGIDIFCCQDVTVSNCNIKTGDDCIAVRAYSLPLGENTPCERITVTNCNLTSHTSGIRLGWLGDGVIRNCTFSNINITDSTSGIEIRIPKGASANVGHMAAGPDGRPRYTDQGTEKLHIENIHYSNINIDNCYYAPLQFCIAANDFQSCESIRNIYLNNVTGSGHFMPSIRGTDDCYFENIYLTNCHFEALPWAHTQEMEEELGGEKLHRPIFEKVHNLVMQDTVFSVE